MKDVSVASIGDRRYAIARELGFIGNVFDPNDGLFHPLTSALEASFIEKYGLRSYELGGSYDWVLTKTTRRSRSKNGLRSEWYRNAPTRRPITSSAYATHQIRVVECGASSGLSNVLCIVLSSHATIQLNSSGKTKADGRRIAIGDPPICPNDIRESVKQLKVDAIKIHKTASKATAPKL